MIGRATASRQARWHSASLMKFDADKHDAYPSALMASLL